VTLAVFAFVSVPCRPLVDGARSEAEWMMRAADQPATE
jgi:hypothetical protein